MIYVQPGCMRRAVSLLIEIPARTGRLRLPEIWAGHMKYEVQPNFFSISTGRPMESAMSPAPAADRGF